MDGQTGGFFMPSNTSGNPLSSSGWVTASPWTATLYGTEVGFCQHVTGSELVEYIDGKVFAHCVNCAARIEVGRVPGGVNLLRLRDVLSVMQSEIECDLVGLYAEIREAVQAEREALEEAELLLSLMDTMMRSMGGVNE
jgi:hypothetical protein